MTTLSDGFSAVTPLRHQRLNVDFDLRGGPWADANEALGKRAAAQAEQVAQHHHAVRLQVNPRFSIKKYQSV